MKIWTVEKDDTTQYFFSLVEARKQFEGWNCWAYIDIEHNSKEAYTLYHNEASIFDDKIGYKHGYIGWIETQDEPNL